MKFLVLPAFALSLMLPLAAMAQQPSAAPAPAEPKTPTAENADPKEKKECRSEEVTGSRFKKKVCYTAAQWEERDRNTREFMQELDRRPVKRDGNGGI